MLKTTLFLISAAIVFLAYSASAQDSWSERAEGSTLDYELPVTQIIPASASENISSIGKDILVMRASDLSRSAAASGIASSSRFLSPEVLSIIPDIRVGEDEPPIAKHKE